MTIQTINVGLRVDDGTGDPARTAFSKINDNFSEIYSWFGSVGADAPLRFAPYYAEHAEFYVRRSSVGTYEGHNDEQISVGYNLENRSTAEPAFSINQECDYWASHKGETVRTTEHYLQIRGPTNAISGAVTDGTVRPWFWAYSPSDTSLNHSGELAYGFLLTGPYKLFTAGGGGLVIGSGSDNTTGAVIGFDGDGAHAYKAIMVQTVAPLAVTAATVGTGCVFTVATGHGFVPGSNITLYGSLDSAPVSLVTGNVTAITGTTITTDIDNSGSAYIPASPSAGLYGVKLPIPTSQNQIVARTIGVNTSVMSGGTDCFRVAGPSTFLGKVYATDYGATSTSAGSGTVLSLSKILTNFQAMTFSNTAAMYALGHLSGNTDTLALGPSQSTDSDFTSANSLLTLRAGHGVGIGGATSTNAKLRIRGGSSTVMQIHLNNQTDGNDYGSTPSASGVLYVKAGALLYKGSSGTVTTLAVA